MTVNKAVPVPKIQIFDEPKSTTYYLRT
uniref:Uncharacterized protein n=1 Tax=Arundo donax TaxID=35708 RepID=A0A0A9AFC3_ARUDO